MLSYVKFLKNIKSKLKKLIFMKKLLKINEFKTKKQFNLNLID